MKKTLSLASEMHFNLENEISFSHSQKARDLETLSVEWSFSYKFRVAGTSYFLVSFWSQLVIVTEGQQKSFSELSLHCFQGLTHNLHISIWGFLSRSDWIKLVRISVLPSITSSSSFLFMYNQPSCVEVAAGLVVALAGSMAWVVSEGRWKRRYREAL